MSKLSILSNIFPKEICNYILNYDDEAKILLKPSLNKIEKLHISPDIYTRTETISSNNITILLMKKNNSHLYKVYVDRFNRLNKNIECSIMYLIECSIMYLNDSDEYIYIKTYNTKD